MVVQNVSAELGQLANRWQWYSEDPPMLFYESSSTQTQSYVHLVHRTF